MMEHEHIYLRLIILIIIPKPRVTVVETVEVFGWIVHSRHLMLQSDPDHIATSFKAVLSAATAGSSSALRNMMIACRYSRNDLTVAGWCCIANSYVRNSS